MKITLRGKNIEITEAIEEKVSEKLSKLDKYFIVSENVEAKVLVRTYPYGQKIEVTIPTEYVLLRADMEEAIMQMELIGHSFFVYRDTETDAISIVYRRNDGDYGLIETE